MRKVELPEDLVLSEAQMREVIELAAQLPPRSDGVPLAALRQIARELDIDQDALDRALAQVLGRPPARLRITWLGRLLLRRGRAIAGALTAAFLGWLSGHVTDTLREVINGITVMRGSGAFIDVPVAVALVLLTLLNSLSRRLDGRRMDYFVEMLATWGAFFIARSLQDGYVTQDGTRFVVIAVLGFALWGCLIIRPRPALWAFWDPALEEQNRATDPVTPEAERRTLQRGTQLRVFWAGLLRPRSP